MRYWVDADVRVEAVGVGLEEAAVRVQLEGHDQGGKEVMGVLPNRQRYHHCVCWDEDPGAALTLTNGRPRRVVFIKWEWVDDDIVCRWRGGWWRVRRVSVARRRWLGEATRCYYTSTVRGSEMSTWLSRRERAAER
jgi:hypothetical protein